MFSPFCFGYDVPMMSETQALRSSIVSKCIYQLPLAKRSLICHHNLLDTCLPLPSTMPVSDGYHFLLVLRATEPESLKSKSCSGLSEVHKVQKSLYIA